MVRSIWHKNTSVRGSVERSLKELEAADPGSDHRRVREIHLRIDPGATEDLRVDIAAGDETGGDPTRYNIKLGLEWSHELPIGAVRTRLHTETALRALRTLVAEQLPVLPAPLGFQPHRLGTTNRLAPAHQSHRPLHSRSSMF